ncbi:MAG: hypothetical protein EXS35_11140 [Pedosphaera sp.]|nr:hypothetical protein [Pedosphaera sp.]
MFVFACLVASHLPPALLAAPPPNDTCAGAEVILGAGPFPYLSSVVDVLNATTNNDPAPPSCAVVGVLRGVWYRFTPNATKLYTLACSGDTATTVQDTVMAIYTSTGGCAGPFVELDCNDDSGDLQSAISRTLTSNVTYYIVIWMTSVSPTLPGKTSVQLRISQPVLPANDTCAGAEIISASGPFPYLTSVTDNTLATTTGDPTPTCWAEHVRSVWYRYTPEATAPHEFSLCTNTATTVYETLLAVYTSAGGCAGPFTQVACSQSNLCGNLPRSTLNLTLTNGVTYYLVAWEGVNDDYIPGETSLQLRVNRYLSPTATTAAASSLTTTSAVLNASVNPNNLPTTAWFDWGPTTSYGNSTAPQNLGSGGGGLSFSAGLNGLPFAAPHHFRIHATNSLGVTLGADQSFTTLAPTPSATTRPATNVTSVSATLNALVNPNGFSASAFFQYGLTTNYGSTTGATNLGAGTNGVPITAAVSGLQPALTYHFRVVATNVSASATGLDQSFAWSTSPPLFTSFAPAGPGFNLQFTAQSAQVYLVQAAEDLTNWITLGPASDNGGGNFSFQDPNTVSFPYRFYRVLGP